jgi:hypothetical protein
VDLRLPQADSSTMSDLMRFEEALHLFFSVCSQDDQCFFINMNNNISRIRQRRHDTGGICELKNLLMIYFLNDHRLNKGFWFDKREVCQKRKLLLHGTLQIGPSF